MYVCVLRRTDLRVSTQRLRRSLVEMGPTNLFKRSPDIGNPWSTHVLNSAILCTTLVHRAMNQGILYKQIWFYLLVRSRIHCLPLYRDGVHCNSLIGWLIGSEAHCTGKDNLSSESNDVNHVWLSTMHQFSKILFLLNRFKPLNLGFGLVLELSRQWMKLIVDNITSSTRSAPKNDTEFR